MYPKCTQNITKPTFNQSKGTKSCQKSQNMAKSHFLKKWILLDKSIHKVGGIKNSVAPENDFGNLGRVRAEKRLKGYGVCAHK